MMRRRVWVCELQSHWFYFKLEMWKKNTEKNMREIRRERRKTQNFHHHQLFSSNFQWNRYRTNRRKKVIRRDLKRHTNQFHPLIILFSSSSLLVGSQFFFTSYSPRNLNFLLMEYIHFCTRFYSSLSHVVEKKGQWMKYEIGSFKFRALKWFQIFHWLIFFHHKKIISCKGIFHDKISLQTFSFFRAFHSDGRRTDDGKIFIFHPKKISTQNFLSLRVHKFLQGKKWWLLPLFYL